MNKPRIHNGFTVVELVVSLTVSAIVIASTHELFVSLRTLSVAQSRSANENNETLSALDQMRTDLMHAIIPAGKNETVFKGGVPQSLGDNTTILEFYKLGFAEYSNEVPLCIKVKFSLCKTGITYSLYRITSPPWPNTDQYSSKYLICSNIQSMELLFHEKDQMQATVDLKDNLPPYVQIKMSLYGQQWTIGINLPSGFADKK